jgi:hypothetical protein
VLLVALVLWLFRDALFFGGVFFKRDIHLVWHPQVEGFVRAIAGLSWPTWDPSPAFGQPLLADPGAMVLYPPTWLNLVVRPWVYYTLFAAGHLLFAALGMRWLARLLGLEPMASLAAALLWAMSGPYVSMVDLWHHYAGGSWMPWVVGAALRALAGGRREVALLALALGAQVLAGSADMCAMTLLLAAGLGAAVHLRTSPLFSRKTSTALARGAAGVLLGLGLSAVLWMSALEVVSRAARAELPSSMRTYWSLHPVVLVETLLPGLLSSLPLRRDLALALFQSREPFLSSLYLGVSTLPLVVVAASSRRPLSRVLLGALLLAGLVALGSHTPVYGALTTLVPPLRILRYPVKAMVVVAFSWALLGGLGVSAWRERSEGRRFALSALAPVGLACAAAALLAFAFVSAPGPVADRLLSPSPERRLALVMGPASARLLVALGFAAAALALAFTGLRGRLGEATGVALLGLAGLDLAYHHRSPNPVAPKALYTHRPPVLAALGDLPSARVYVYDYSVPGKADRYLGPHAYPYKLARLPEGFGPAAAEALGVQMYLGSEIAGRWGLSQAYGLDIRGLHLLPLTKLTRLLRDVEETPVHRRLLEAGGVTHTVSLHRLPELEVKARLEGLFERPILVQKVEAPLPRTYVVGTARQAADEQAVALFLDPGFDPRREIVVAAGEERRAAPGFRATSRIVEARADRMTLEAELDAPGYVVVLDTFDPGWRARVDGQEAPILRANLAFRAVAAPAGRHEVQLTYRPLGVRLGLVVSGLALLVLVAALGRRPA